MKHNGESVPPPRFFRVTTAGRPRWGFWHQRCHGRGAFIAFDYGKRRVGVWYGRWYGVPRWRIYRDPAWRHFGRNET